MRRFLSLVVFALAATAASGSVLVLKGGKRVEGVGLAKAGNYFVVSYPGGRSESYPASAVDVAATKAANEAPATAAAPAGPAGPHSPFFGAQAPAGKPVLVVTDNDVQHVEPPDETAAPGQGKATGQPSAEGQVVLVDYGKQRLDDGTWEITATVINSGGSPVTGVSADVRLLDAEGKAIGSGTATMEGTLAPTQQGAVTARVAAPSEPIQIGFSFRWQSITPQPAPAVDGAGAAPAAGSAAEAAAAAPAKAAPPPRPGYTVPPGSSPGTLPTEPMAVPGNLLQPPTVLQVPRGEAPKKP
jgi:hypothetical protein